MRKKKCNNKVNPLTTRESEFSESGVHPMYYPVFRNTFKNDEFRYYFFKKNHLSMYLRTLCWNMIEWINLILRAVQPSSSDSAHFICMDQ